MERMAVDAGSEAERLTEQRRALPDQPGVYLFRDERGGVIYVGKAKSIRKRVASHFSNPALYGTRAMTDDIDHIESIAVATEAEALLTEQTFIKQYKPRFNIRLRDDKSYPYIAISLDEDFPRVYFTRERHRRERAYSGPYSSAKRVRNTLDLLGKIFQLRSCEGPEPGRHSGSPCLDYYIKRCGAPCVGYVSKEEYREGIDGVVAFLSGRFRQIEKDLERRAALRPPVLLPRQPGGAGAGDRRGGVPAPVLHERARHPVLDRRPAGAGGRLRAGGPRLHAVRPPRRRRRDPGGGARRQAPDPRARGAQRAARARPGEAQGGAPPPAARGVPQRPAGGAAARRAPGPDRVLRHLARRRDPHGGLDGGVRGRRAEESRLPPLHHPLTRQQRRLRFDERGALASLCPVGEAARALPLRRRARRLLRGAAEPRGDRRWAGPAVGRPRGGARLPRARGRRRVIGQAHRGGLRARREAARADGARHAGAAAPAARARRGAPLRDHAPPDPPRQGHDGVDHGRPPGGRADAKAGAPAPLRLARGDAGRDPGAAGGRARRARQGRPRPLPPPQQDGAVSAPSGSPRRPRIGRRSPPGSVLGP